MVNETDSMLDAYLFEARELIEQLDAALLSCEEGGGFDAESVNLIFRIMHTIKGSSAMMEFDCLTAISHRVEDLFAAIREKGLPGPLTGQVFDLVFRANDFIKAGLDSVEAGR